MNILILGSGGREHAFAWKIAQSRHCEALYIAPGNAGTADIGTNVALNPNDFPAIGAFCLEHTIGLVVVGPEEPLVRGIRDYFESEKTLKKILLVGPGKAGAVMEGSKAWSKAFMQRHAIPTAAYAEFTADTLDAGLDFLKKQTLPIVLKADGLAAGKGVLICQSHEEAALEFRAMLGGKFGAAGATVVVEEFLDGIEYSVFILTDGKDYVLLPEAKDYKRIGEGDTGLNTGGMGAVSPVPFVDEALWEKTIQQIVEPTVRGLEAEKIPYKGFIFFGLINVDGQPKVIEYNARMGDPETEVVFPRIKSDIVPLLKACALGKLKGKKLRLDKKFAATTFLVSGGYPEAYKKSMEMSGFDDVQDACILFHAGTKAEGGKILTNGGRVLAVTAQGRTLNAALRKSRRNARIIKFKKKNFRKDIGFDLLT